MNTKILAGKHEGKISRGKSGHRSEDNIRMDLQERGFQDVGWTHLTQDTIQ